MRDPQQNDKREKSLVPLMPTKLIQYVLDFYEKLHGYDVYYSNKVYTLVQEYTPLRIVSKAIGLISDGPALPMFLLLYWYAKLPSAILFAIYTISWMLIHEFIIKAIFKRKRPYTAGKQRGLSFPSSHSFASGYIFTLCAFLPLPFKPFLILFSIINATNRPALGVHYIADVVAGLTLGAIVAFGWVVILP
jgi:membrane-associated phospholipid phosphatase